MLNSSLPVLICSISVAIRLSLTCGSIPGPLGPPGQGQPHIDYGHTTSSPTAQTSPKQLVTHTPAQIFTLAVTEIIDVIVSTPATRFFKIIQQNIREGINDAKTSANISHVTTSAGLQTTRQSSGNVSTALTTVALTTRTSQLSSPSPTPTSGQPVSKTTNWWERNQTGHPPGYLPKRPDEKPQPKPRAVVGTNGNPSSVEPVATTAVSPTSSPITMTFSTAVSNANQSTLASVLTASLLIVANSTTRSSTTSQQAAEDQVISHQNSTAIPHAFDRIAFN